MPPYQDAIPILGLRTGCSPCRSPAPDERIFAYRIVVLEATAIRSRGAEGRWTEGALVAEDESSSDAYRHRNGASGSPAATGKPCSQTVFWSSFWSSASSGG